MNKVEQHKGSKLITYHNSSKENDPSIWVSLTVESVYEHMATGKKGDEETTD